jgi:hypothetical protein
MENLFRTKQHINQLWPKVELIRRERKVSVSGISRMPEPSKYYTILANQLEDYFIEFDSKLLVEFFFDYINSSSVKWLYFLMQHLEFLTRNGGVIEVVWNYIQDDESIELTGDVLKSQSSLPFYLVPVDY